MRRRSCTATGGTPQPEGVDAADPSAAPSSFPTRTQATPPTACSRQHRGRRLSPNADKSSGLDATLLALLLIVQLIAEPAQQLRRPIPKCNVLSGAMAGQQMAKQSAVRKLFDPVVGEFYTDVSKTGLLSFFNAKTRYRNDAALADFASRSRDPVLLNMMMVEQPLRPSNVQSRQAQPADPSLLDYDAIDQSWRRDIEQEKGNVELFEDCSNQGCSSSHVFDDQFQRDLQILTEKSLFAPLTTEETFRYEDLSKAQFADFYRSVPQNLKGRDHRLEWLSPSEMKKAMGDLDDPSDFFNNLGKESDSAAEHSLQVYSNLTLCNNQDWVLNDISLAPSDNWDLLPPTSTEDNETEQSELPDELKDFEPQTSLNLTSSDADQILNDEQVKEDLEDASWMHEFDGMSILGEFRNFFVDEQNEQRDLSPVPIAASFEEVLNSKNDRETSPSSGIGSMRSSASSPSHVDEPGTSDTENRFVHSRVYNKLVPFVRQSYSSVSSESSATSRAAGRRLSPFSFSSTSSLNRPISVQNSGVQQRKRGRQSKDEQLAIEHGLPATAEEFAAMTHMEIQGFMRDPTLSPYQKALIKKIRRRGRNKVAARKCRERRTGPDESGPSRQPMRGVNLLNDPTHMSLYDF